MELKLLDGKYVCDKRGMLEVADSADEIVQRILMKLQTKKGSFLPLPDYGSRLYMLPNMLPSKREAAARQFVSEALSGEADITLETLELTMITQNEARINMIFNYRGTEKLRVTTDV